MALFLALLLSLAPFVGAHPARAAEPTRVSADRVAAIARTWLVDRLGAAAGGTTVELLATPRDIVLPAGPVTLQTTLQAGSLNGGLVTMLVEGIVPDASGAPSARSTTVSFRITRSLDAVVAVRELSRRTIVTANDVRVERRTSDRLPPGAVNDVRDVIGKEVARPIAPGELLTTTSVAVPIAIRRGSVITLLLDGQGFRITARGVAAEDGTVGQMIRVVNQASRREMTGKIEDEHTVRIPF